MLRLLLVLALAPSAALAAGLQGASPTVNPLHYTCGPSSSLYAPNSAYMSNLMALSIALVAQVRASGFASGRSGTAPDAVYGLALCRGDYPASYCGDSLAAAFHDVIENGLFCPMYKDATVFYDQHILRFSDDDFSLGLSNDPEWVAWNMNNVTGADAERLFGERLLELMNATADYAATASTIDSYATGETWFGEQGLDKIYGLVQCTPDLTAVECRSCLAEIISQMPTWFIGASGDRVGGRIIGVRCNLRYEKDPFFQETKDTIKLHMPRSKGGMSKMDMTLSIVAGFVVLVLLLILGIWTKWKIKDSRIRKWHKAVKQHIDPGFQLFTFSTIRDATGRFSEARILGRGSFGSVFRGTLRNGLEIAAKRRVSSWQGMDEFLNEIRLIVRIQHANLVKLIGCCVQRKEQILVYEYMPSNSLYHVLSDPARRESLNWLTRLRIINGIAQGLVYLHNYLEAQQFIIHRDLKLSNILLDGEMNPKISDFGISRMFPQGGPDLNTTNNLVGTFGYMPPEYIREGILSVKYDVFSFGVLLLEIISGKRVNVDVFIQHGRSDHLLTHAWRVWENGTWGELVDPSVHGQYEDTKLSMLVGIALLCVQENPDSRPDMHEVITMLSSSNVIPRGAQQPAYFNRQLGNTDPLVPNHDSTNYVTAPLQQLNSD